ncbi:TPA: hypothetical protein ACW0UL_004655 [Citrobacter freundii]
MKDGIYKVTFDSNVNRNGRCDGIITIMDGKVSGGDYVCFYRGTLTEDKIELQVVRHNPNDTTVFNGVDDVTLQLAIKEMHGGAVFNGAVKGQSSLTISGGMHFLSDLV